MDFDDDLKALTQCFTLPGNQQLRGGQPENLDNHVARPLLAFFNQWNLTQKMSVATPKRRDWKVYRWTRSYNFSDNERDSDGSLVV